MEIKIPRNQYLRIKVIPKSGKNEVVSITEDGDGEKSVKIRIAAPPEKGKANNELIKFLSKELNIHKENIFIISGKSTPLKLIRINYGTGKP